MSHFTVLVIGENWEEQLKPYQENNMDDCPKEFLTFNEDEDSEVDETTGKRGWWENKNRKWDWYSMGGRWAGYFKLKSLELAGVQGHHRAKDFANISGKEIDDLPIDRVDQAKNIDIDFEGMKSEAMQKAKDRYEMLERLCEGKIPKLKYLWKTLINDKKFKDLDIEDKRSIYHGQEGKKKIDSARKKSLNEKEKSFLTWLELDEYQISKKEYIEKETKNNLPTFAVLKEGKWYEKGDMGCWGFVGGEKDGDVWTTEFNKLINQLPDETIFTIVDCHI